MNEQPSDSARRDGLAVLGTVLLYAGAAFVFFLVIARSPESTVPLPRFLYQHRELWLVAGGGLVAAGMLCLRKATPASEPVASPFQSVVLYTRTECHLCDVAKEVLNRYRERLPGIDEVDIDDDPELIAEFGEHVPVVEIDGRVRFRGRVDEMLLRRLLDGADNEPTKEANAAQPADVDSETPS